MVMANTERFQRLPKGEFVAGSKVANRIHFYNEQSPHHFSVGDFVSRLWALFGPPDQVGDEGFTYCLMDTESGFRFLAYAAGSGPAYGALTARLDVLEVFERLVSTTPPADCEITYETDFGTYSSGARNGIPFDEKAKRRKRR